MTSPLPKGRGRCTSDQRPRGHGRTTPPAAPHRSTEQGHCARSKQAHAPDDHYDDYEDISVDSLAQFVLRLSIPPRLVVHGILKMVDYKSGTHDVYKERYTTRPYIKRSLIQISAFGSSSMQIGTSTSFWPGGPHH
jgi:hypothetical protein